MSATFRVAIVEADCIFREGLRRVLGRHPVKVVAVWSSVDEALDGPPLLAPLSVVLVSSLRNGYFTPEHAELLRERHPSVRIAILAESYSGEVAPMAAAAEVDGVLLSSSSPANLVKSLELIGLGQNIFPMPQFAPGAIHDRPNTSEAHDDVDGLDRLSVRERQVLAGLAQGAPNKVIARDLKIADATVKVHVKSILRKTGVANRTEAALWARNAGMN